MKWSPAAYEALKAQLGDKGAGLRILEALGLEVSPYEIVPTAVFASVGGRMRNDPSAISDGLSQSLREAYRRLTGSQTPTRVLLRGSLAVRRSSCGLTYSQMIDRIEELESVAARIIGAFQSIVPPFDDNEGLAFILQQPSFHDEKLSHNVITGNLAVRGEDMLIEVCEGTDLRKAAKWWNGTVGGYVSWALDGCIDGGCTAYVYSRDTAGTYTAAVTANVLSPGAPERVRAWGDVLIQVARVGRRVRDAVSFDVDIEWVCVRDSLFVHQLRPLRHRVATGDRPVALTGPNARFDSGIALCNGRATGRLFRPDKAIPPPRSAEQPQEPYILMTPVTTEVLNKISSALLDQAEGILDPTLGSRLSHFSANYPRPYIAVPGFPADRFPWTRIQGGWISENSWDISPADDG